MESLVCGLKNALPEKVKSRNPCGIPAFVSTKNPLAFWDNLIGSLEHGAPAVLMDPHWPGHWKNSLTALFPNKAGSKSSSLFIPTSGSTGMPKFCIHNSDTLLSAARGYREHFGTRGIIHSVNILPQHHIGGLMPVIRSAVCGGKVHFADYRNPDSIQSAEFLLEEASISVVPTQLRRMCESPAMVDLLGQFALILIGGAACPSDLLDRCRNLGLNLGPCYGSTETAAMVSVLPPDKFLAGSNSVGMALPHAQIDLLDEGVISVQSESLLHGYFPEKADFSRSPFLTGDIGWLDLSGELHISGRADRVIISGGENVHPEAIENAAMASGLLLSAECLGIQDPDWGTRIELRVRPVRNRTGIQEALTRLFEESLPPYARPKRIHLVADDEVS